MPIACCSLGHKVYQLNNTNVHRSLGLLPSSDPVSQQILAKMPLYNVSKPINEESIMTSTVTPPIKHIYSISGKPTTKTTIQYVSIDWSISGILSLKKSTNAKLPKNVPVYDQLRIGSCTANAGCELLLYHSIIPNFLPSRMYYYYCERDAMNTVNTDSGATMAVCCAVLMGIKINGKIQYGTCREIMWPYPGTEVNNLNYNLISAITTPPGGITITQCNTDALDNGLRGLNPNGVIAIANNFTNLYNCLYNIGPFMFGLNIYSSFQYLTRTKYTYNPKTGSEQYLGGHAVICVGYYAPGNLFICQNSWGTLWGYNGFFCIPSLIMTSARIVSGIYTIYSVTLD